MRNATKRAVASVAVSLLTASALVGFGTSAQAVTAANTFTVAFPAERGGVVDRWVTLINAFNKANPTYKAVAQGDPSDAYGANILTKLNAGAAADVFKVQPGYGAGDAVLPLVKAKFLRPLNDTKATTASNAKSSVINVGGKVYASSMGQVVGNLVANRSLMEADGVAWPKSFPALLEACKAARDKGHTFFVLAGALWNNNELLYSNLSASSVYANGDSFNVLRNGNKATFSSNPAWVDVMNKIVQMNNAKCFQDGVAAGTFADIDAKFIGGKAYAAFIPGSLSVAFSNGPMRGKVLKTQAFPGAPVVSAESNYALAINAKSKKAAAAKKFIDYVTSVAGQKVYSDVAGTLPLKIDAKTKLADQYSELVPLLLKGKTFTHPKTTWNTSSQVAVKLGTGVQGLLTGQASVGQVLRSADAAW